MSRRDADYPLADAETRDVTDADYTFADMPTVVEMFHGWLSIRACTSGPAGVDR